MDELTNMLITFINTYGWQLALCALSGIFVLGIFKCFGIYKKIQNAQLRKFMYLLSSVLLSMAACAVYLHLHNCLEWKSLLVIGASIFALTQVSYQLYETSGIRALWRKLLQLIVNVLDKICGAVKNKMLISLGANALRELADHIEVEAKEKKEAEEQKQEAKLQKEYEKYRANGGLSSYDDWKASL